MSGYDDLLKGFAAFRQQYYSSAAGKQGGLMPRLVADGQDPDYFIVSCIDSRSNPGTIFGAPPGTFFAHKAMGAIVRPYKKGTALAAALHFAINYNKVSKIIILGHTGCGAIKAMVEELDDDEIAGFTKVAQEGLENAKSCCSDPSKHDDLFRHAEEQIILQSTENLKTYPSVRDALAAGRIEVASWLFNMEEGAIYSYDPEKKDFVALPLPAV